MARSRVPGLLETRGYAGGRRRASGMSFEGEFRAAGMPPFDLPAATVDALVAMIASLNASAAKTSVPGDGAAGKQFFFGQGAMRILPYGVRRRVHRLGPICRTWRSE